MARILEFTIDGLAGRDEPFSASLNSDVNVFFGLNGSGKTTLLKILHAALSTDTQSLRQLPFTRARVKVFLNRHTSSFVRTFGQPAHRESKETFSVVESDAVRPRSMSRLLLGSHLGSKAATRWTSDPPEPDDAALTTFKRGFLPISRLYRNVRSSTGSKRLSDQELDGAFARELQSQWSSYYADISQEITKAQERGLANILGFFLSARGEEAEDSDAPDATEAFRRIQGFLERQPGYSHLLRSEGEFGALYTKRPDLRNVVKQIEKIEQSIDSISAPRERFREVLESMFTGSKHLVFTDKEIQVQLPTEETIGLSLLSSGEKQLLFLAFNALTGGNHSLVIDEPELSMHVDWQKRLVSTLLGLNPKIQLIMATHSPEIMADLADDKIFRL